MSKVRTEKELASSISRGDDEIIVEGDLANKAFKIKATGTVAWGIAIAAIVVAVGAVLSAPATGPAAPPVAMALAGPAVVTLGAKVTFTAIGIAVAAGGVGVLNSLREYKVVSHNKNRLVLRK